MKKTLLIVLPLLLIVGCSKPVEESTLISKDGLMYLPDSDSPYSGEVFTNYDTGEKEYQGIYENGLLVEYSYLNKDGSVKEPINYETTLVERKSVYYTKDTNKPYSGPVFSLYEVGGQKKSEGNLKDGGKNGLWTDWYENGQKGDEGTYKDGKLDGLWTYWDENGQKKSEITYKDGMVYVAGGTFQMGSNSESDEKPVHTVTISGFFMDKTEVTQAEYRKVMGKNPSNFSGCDDCPVEQVSWYGAVAYAKKVGKRLPTEAEWEYAARGGNKSKGYRYSGSNNLDAVAWSRVNSGHNKTHPVAEKQPNELGLYDMSGNVWEWCSDWYGSYSSSPQNNPQGPSSGSYRVLRGGCWYNYDYVCRVANRGGSNPDNRYYYYGFRLVLSQD